MMDKQIDISASMYDFRAVLFNSAAKSRIKSIVYALFLLYVLSFSAVVRAEALPLTTKCNVRDTSSCLTTGEMVDKCLQRDKEPGMCAKLPMSADGIVRLSKIEVYPQYLDEYVKYAIEVGEVSLRTEPGVLTMYAVSEKDNPCHITILETYASQEAYKSHIASEHFQKYKQGTLHMVKTLVLSDQTPLNPANQLSNIIQ